MQSERESPTNLIATGWLVRRLTPVRVRAEGGKKGKGRRENTLEDNTKGALPNLLPDTEVVADDAGCVCGLRGMV